MIKIGTRDSKLAIYQAEKVQQKLKEVGVEAELVFVKTIGDKDQFTPLNAFKNPGIFANEINEKVQLGEIDLGVHSCKDMPSSLASDLEIGAVLQRGNTVDTLVYKPSFTQKLASGETLKIATSSERRRLQWLAKYPNSEIIELRGNIPTRLQKLYDNDWDGAIYAQAALDRLEIIPEYSLPLQEFVPAACQGTIAIVSRVNDKNLENALNQINHQPTFILTQIERQVLRALKIGCSTPFGCVANFDSNNLIVLKAQLFNNNGSIVINSAVSGLAIRKDELIAELLIDLNAKGADKILAEMKC